MEGVSQMPGMSSVFEYASGGVNDTTAYVGCEPLTEGSVAYLHPGPLMALLAWPWLSLVAISGTALYVTLLGFYRLYLSPLARFPGPILAKTTHWYEFYHNFIRTGRYYEEIWKMHELYGPVVRVTPDEIHVLDGPTYHKLFVGGAVRKTNAYRRFSNGTGFEDMTAISTAHDAHRRLRGPLDRLFARNSIRRIEPRVVGRCERLCNRLREHQGTGEVVGLTNAISSLTTDVISAIIFEEPSDYLGDPNFNEQWYEILKRGTKSVPLFKHMPWLIQMISKPLLRYVVMRVTKWTIWDEKARREILLIRKRPSDEVKTRDETTVLDHLVHSELVERELGGDGGFARLAQLIQQAGAHNVSHTLGTIVTYLLLEPKKLQRLRDEIETVWAIQLGDDASPSWLELEKLPYLSACITEGLRMAIGGMNRTPRIFPDDELECCGWIIPKGTPISMSTFWMHNDPDVYQEPQAFNPDRWLTEDLERLQVMQAYFVPFAKGSRNCVGQNLVYMQMFHTLAHLFRPGAFEIRLHDTTLRDIIAVHGLLFPMPPFDSKGVQVTIH